MDFEKPSDFKYELFKPLLFLTLNLNNYYNGILHVRKE